MDLQRAKGKREHRKKALIRKIASNNTNFILLSSTAAANGTKIFALIISIIHIYEAFALRNDKKKEDSHSFTLPLSFAVLDFNQIFKSSFDQFRFPLFMVSSPSRENIISYHQLEIGRKFFTLTIKFVSFIKLKLIFSILHFYTRSLIYLIELHGNLIFRLLPVMMRGIETLKQTQLMFVTLAS